MTRRVGLTAVLVVVGVAGSPLLVAGACCAVASAALLERFLQP